jgi:hypothetical protein
MNNKDTKDGDSRWACPSHPIFNEERFGVKPPNYNVTAPWIPQGYVPLTETFRQAENSTSNDPAPRRETIPERQDGGSSMVKEDRPRHDLRPPPHIRDPVDRAAFNDRWLEEERKAIFARASPDQERSEQAREHTPSRRLTR